MSKPTSLHSVIGKIFSPDELIDLAAEYDPGFELIGATRTSKMRNLMQHAKSRMRTDDLLDTIRQFRPSTDELDLQPYLYLLIVEDFGTAEGMKSLCESLRSDCRELLVTGIGIHDYTHLTNYVTDQAVILQDQMTQEGRLGELVQAMQKAKPRLNLKVFEYLVTRGDPIPDPVPANGSGKEQQGTAVSPMQYENFDIRVRRKGSDGRYPIEVTKNPIQAEMYDPIYQTFPVDDYDFTDLIDYLSDLVARKEHAKELGKIMQELLFPGEVWDIFFASLTRMKREEKGLRIRLRLDAPELSQWPWEYCYYDHPDYGFFALDSSVPIVRYLPGSFESKDLTVPDPLKVLVVVSEPRNQQKLQVEKEVTLIERILSLMGSRVQVRVLREATYERIQGALAEKPQIFHYIGHGDTQDGQGVLILKDKFGMSDYRDAEQMQVMLKDRGIKVAILNACKTASHNAHNVFNGMAPALIKAQIPAVIAMQFNVPDETALSFTLNLYRYLVSGYPLDTAVTEMRKGAFNHDKYFWGIPVLYMRAPDGILWPPDPQLLSLFDKAQQEVDTISVDSPADLLGEIIKEVNNLVKNEKLSDRDARYVVRGLEEAQSQFNNESPDVSVIKQELERAIDDLQYSKSKDAIQQVVPKIQHVLQQYVS